MIVLLIVGAVFIIGMSLALAWWSMKDFQEIPNRKFYYSTYLVSKETLNGDFFRKLYKTLLLKEFKRLDPPVISFERVQKGNVNSVVIYGPKIVLEKFPELHVMELEDYTSKLNVGLTQAFELIPEKSKSSPIAERRHTTFLFQGLELEDGEYAFVQVCLAPLRRAQQDFHTTVRVVVSARTGEKRAALAKDFESKLRVLAGLGRLVNKKNTSLQTFELYKKRGLYSRLGIDPGIAPDELEKILKA